MLQSMYIWWSATAYIVFKVLSMENGGLLQPILSIVASCTLFCPRHQAYMEGFHFSSPPPPPPLSRI